MKLELRFKEGDLAGKRFSVPMSGLRLGRSSQCDIHSQDAELSRSHCLFEATADGALRVTDLASANGTFVNGEMLGSAAVTLKAGDEVVVGQTVIAVVSAEPTANAAVGGNVDLGLGAVRTASAAVGKATAEPAKRRPAVNLLLAAAAVVVLGAIALILQLPMSKPAKIDVALDKPKAQEFCSLCYEKIEADAQRIFRYEMMVDREGGISVRYDDVPEANRHVDKRGKLSESSLKEISELFDREGWKSLEDCYSGSSAESENALRSLRVRVVRGDSIKEVLAENAPEPDALRDICEALEAFSRNELGIWAIQYSREKLLELSQASEEVGDAKWSECDVEYGNISASIVAYREAVFYLETVNPKPEGYSGLKDKLRRSEEELEKRYKEQRFLADKALNLGDWEQAKAELVTLCAMVPQKNDPRHAEANAKLVDVENRIAKAKRKSKGGDKDAKKSKKGVMDL